MTRLFLLLLALLATPLALAGNKPTYSYFRVGNTADVAPMPQPGVVLMGGSTDVDAAFQWLCQRSGNGDFLVIRATGTDAYNPYVRDLCPGENSVATLIIPDATAANNPTVADILSKAEAVWIAGGDQSNYINFWTGTPVQSTLNALIASGVPVGGTSAGLNVLTQFVYTAQASQGVTSAQALADPFNRYMTFGRDFVNLPVLAGVIGDPHFGARDRMGRDLAFLCRVAANGWSNAPRGIAVDEQTALLIDAQGSGSVVGSGNVYFLKAPGLPEVCRSKTPLTYRNIAVDRIRAGDAFNLMIWQRSGGTTYSVSADAGVLSSTQAGGSAY
ncbi:MAG TPA: cyanophycinase [Lysobacter sp.]|jgi:cyanophycinase|nr:cyanophycinase [Lysobacter sp.]